MSDRSLCRLAVVLFIPACLSGCDRPVVSPPRTDTGAETTAKAFFDALRREDWPAAYDALDADSRSWCSRDRFAKLGQEYRKLIDFTPTDVVVSVTESGDQGTAVAVYRGLAGTEWKSYRDGTALHRTPAGWAVVLRKNFGKKSALSHRPHEAQTGRNDR